MQATSLLGSRFVGLMAQPEMFVGGDHTNLTTRRLLAFADAIRRCYRHHMDDVLFVALAEGVIEYVDEKYGRAAAWLAGVTILAIPVALLVGFVWWLAS